MAVRAGYVTLNTKMAFLLRSNEPTQIWTAVAWGGHESAFDPKRTLAIAAWCVQSTKPEHIAISMVDYPYVVPSRDVITTLLTEINAPIVTLGWQFLTKFGLLDAKTLKSQCDRLGIEQRY